MILMMKPMKAMIPWVNGDIAKIVWVSQNRMEVFGEKWAGWVYFYQEVTLNNQVLEPQWASNLQR